MYIYNRFISHLNTPFIAAGNERHPQALDQNPGKGLWKYRAKSFYLLNAFLVCLPVTYVAAVAFSINELVKAIKIQEKVAVKATVLAIVTVGAPPSFPLPPLFGGSRGFRHPLPFNYY